MFEHSGTEEKLRKRDMGQILLPKANLLKIQWHALINYGMPLNF
jgi:hypothetical protein